MIRTLFVNTAMLGHASVARLLPRVVAGDERIEAVPLDTGEGLARRDRVIRRLLCWGPAGEPTAAASLALTRWRHEMHAGLLAARRIRALERAGESFGVVHFHTQAAAWASLGRMRITPSIVSIDITQRLAREEAPPGMARWGYRPGAARDARVFQAASAITVTSRWAADDLVRHQPGVAGKVHVMPYPVLAAEFDPGWAGERYDAAVSVARPVRLLFMGGDFPRKGGWELLEAWRGGGFAAEGAELVLATGWPIPAAALPPGVRVIRGVRAYEPAWRELWRAADVFVMPTRAEAFGMVYQEASAAGLPVIGTRLAAVPEIVEDGVTGLLVPPRDPVALAAAMRALLASPALRRRMGEAGRARMARISSPEAYGEKLRGLILAAAANGGEGR